MVVADIQGSAQLVYGRTFPYHLTKSKANDNE